jgi:UDP-glucose 4-epimerase
MKVLITGSTGFIGGYIRGELASRGHQITTFDRTANDSETVSKSLQGDVRDSESVADAVDGQDVVVHAAAVLGTRELIDKPHLALDVNTGGTVNVLEGCRRAGSRLVFVSKPNPWLNTYSITKEAAESFCEMYCQVYDVRVQVAKAFNVYGPGERIGPTRVAKAIPTMIMNALASKDIVIHGSGDQRNDFVHVLDVARSVANMVELDEVGYREYEIGTGVDRSINELSQLILNLTDSSSQTVHTPPRVGEIVDDRIRADTTSLRKAFGPVEFIMLEDGLPDTIEHYQRLGGNNQPG